MNAKGLEYLSLLACLAAWPLAAGGQTAGGETEDEHVVRAASGYVAEREPGTLREIGTLTERRIGPDERIVRATGAPKDGTSFTASAYGSGEPDHWIYDAGLEMFFDADEDGYF